MNAKLEKSTVERIQDTIDEPISRGMDKAINACLDQLDELKKKNRGVFVCDETEKEAQDA